MKKLQQIREDYDLITEKEENEERKLVALVRAGLFDAKKIPALKKALDKSADRMTAQERRMLLNLLDELMAQVISNQPVYQKVKQNLMKEEKKSYPVDQTIPSVILLKRRAIRTFPNGEKVALYYAQSIDKYVSIPYSEIGINEETELDENAGAILKGVIKYGGAAISKGKELAAKALNKWKSARDAKKLADKAKQSNKPRATDKAKQPKKPRVADKAKQPKKQGGKPSKTSGGKIGAGAAALGSLAAAASSGSSGSSGSQYFTPMSSKLRANVTGPRREGGADSRMERERQASARATRSMATNESVNLDGNLFEINTKAAKKVSSLYESLNNKNKKKMIEMMNESTEGLEKVISFAVRQ